MLLVRGVISHVVVLTVNVIRIFITDQEMDVEEGVVNGRGPTPGVPQIPREVLSGLAPPPRPDHRDNVEVALGSSDWHSAVPTDWVPIIARDVVRQRRTGAQPPFSDAYLSGMPAKRRKVRVLT